METLIRNITLVEVGGQDMTTCSSKSMGSILRMKSTSSHCKLLPTGQILGSIFVRKEIGTSLWGQFGVDLGSIWGRFGVNLGSITFLKLSA
eukprot:247231-Amphidinium_carterae.1